MYEETYPLIEQLKHYNLDYLIPERMVLLDQEEGRGHHLGNFMRDPDEDGCNDYFDDEAEEDFIDDEYDDEKEEPFQVSVLDDIMMLFNVDYMDPIEFLSMNIWDLFGITKKQFDLIDWSVIAPEYFDSFYYTFIEMDKSLPIEKRVLYSTAEAITGYCAIKVCHGDECTADDMLAYANRIVDTHSTDEIQLIFPMLIDYLRFYPDAIEMNRRRAANGEQPFKYTRRPKVSHLKDLHDKAFRDYQAMETERLAQDREDINRQIKEVSDSREYKKYIFKDENFLIKPVTSQDDLDYEGKYLRHCVASYGSYMARAASYIYLIRKASDPNTPYFTAEIVPGPRPVDKGTLKQCYTFDDTIAKSSECKKFILKWAKSTGFSVKCKL